MTQTPLAPDAMMQRRQMHLAGDLAKDIANRVTGYRGKTDITDYFISVGVSKALVATIIAMSTSEEQAFANFQHLVQAMVPDIKQGWKDRMESEAQEPGGHA